MDNTFGDSIKKIGNLQDELRDSYKLIIEGFRYIEKNDHENNFYFLIFQSLSIGFERFMKSYICLAHKNSEGVYPSSSYIKGISHNLFKLLKEITSKYFTRDKEICQEDYLYLNNDSDFQILFKILTSYAKGDRYHNLDSVSNNLEKTSPEAKWQYFEDCYFKTIGMDKAVLYPREYRERDAQLASYIKSLFERFIASLVRQVQFKYLGQEALSLIIWDYSFFGGLREGDYGKTDYSKVNIESKSCINKPRKNNISNSKNVKEKTLYRDNFNTWPFFVDVVIVKKEIINSYQYCTVVIEDFEYSLNGLAKTKFRIPTPHEAEKAELGVSLSEFIEIALSL